MEKRKFMKAYNQASDQLDKRRLRDVTRKAISSSKSRKLEFIMVMEELAELSQQAAKAGRGIGNRESLIEEMADVCLSLVRLQELYGISTLELNKAINVKMDRLDQVLDKKGRYL